MQEFFRQFGSAIAVGVEATAAVIITFGALQAIYGTLKGLLIGGPNAARGKQVRLRFGVWLLLGLEFELAADIVRTAITPTWNDIGQLAAIGAIRTLLNYFLEQEIDKYAPAQSSVVTKPVAKEGLAA